MKHSLAFAAILMATIIMIIPTPFTHALSDPCDRSITQAPSPTPYWMSYPPIRFQAKPELPKDESGRWLIDRASLSEVEIVVSGGLMALRVSLTNSFGEPVDAVLTDRTLTELGELEDGEYTLFAYDPMVPEVTPGRVVFIIDRNM